MNIRRLLLSVIAGLVVMSCLALWSGPADFGAAMQRIPMETVLLAVIFTLGNYLLRFYRWQLYLRKLAISLPVWRSLAVFLAGMLMSITPGKVGEVLKSLLLKAEIGTPVTLSAPIVFAERLTDLLAVVLLCLAGFALGDARPGLLLTGVVLAVLAVVAAGSETVAVITAKLAGKHGGKVRALFASTRRLLRPGLTLAGLLLGLAAWFCECVGLHLLVQPFLPDLPLAVSVHIYALATLAGALSMLPGGLAATEGGLYLMLQRYGMAGPASAAVTFLVRGVTLWFAVLLGFIVFFAAFDPVRLKRTFGTEKSEGSGEEEVVGPSLV